METSGETKQKMGIHSFTRIALVTAVICVLAPLALPVGPVPISLATLAIYLGLYLLDWKEAALSCAVYILLGAVGLPVFSGFMGGFAKLVGPTGGYIIGYLPMAALGGFVISRSRNRLIRFLGLAAGTAVLYVLGTAWFCFVTKATLAAGISGCVLPFIPGDLLKIAAAMLLGPQLKQQLAKIRK